jgi:hypothetical protein
MKLCLSLVSYLFLDAVSGVFLGWNSVSFVDNAGSIGFFTGLN